MSQKMYVVFTPEVLQVEALGDKRTAIERSGAEVGAMLEQVGIGPFFGLEESGPVILPALGAAVVNLSDDQASELVEMGAWVAPNDLIPLVQPVEVVPMAAPAALPWHLSKVDAPKIWAAGYKGAGTVIGILDTGIDASHHEFAGKKIAFAELTRTGHQVPGAPAHDKGNHGTHVSGIAAGATCGVAPEADLAVACVLGAGGGTFAQIAAGIDWLASVTVDGLDVDVINASLGITGYHVGLYVAIQRALRIDAILTVAAIGNAGARGINNHSSPGNYDIVLGIGATDASDVPAPFSDWGVVPAHGGIPKPDIAAPGVMVLSAIPGGGFAAMSGTSMAAPCVSGAAALRIEQVPGLRGAPGSLRTDLLAHVARGTASPKTGSGRLNL
jgi:subtilisin family serine protease